METTLPQDWATRPAPKNEKEARIAIRQMLAQMAEADVRIAETQAEINRLKIETRAILATLSRPT